MGFLKSFLGGGSTTARREEDQLWMNDDARATGVRKAVERLLGQRHSVVVVAPSTGEVDAIASHLAPLELVRVTDVFSRPALTEALSSAGRVVVAAAAALPADAQHAEIPVDVIGWSRAPKRAADDAVAAFADRLGKKASVAFHLSLDDALLAEHGDRLAPIMKALRVAEDEPISSSMVSRSVENAQKKNG